MTIQTICCLGIIVLTIAAAAMIVLWYRRHTKRLMKQVLNRINEAIAGNYSETKYDEAMLSAIEEKLNQFLTISNETKLETLKERDTIKSLISDISHQTKTPLSNILLYSQLLQEKKEINSNITTIADQIQNQAEKLDFLIDALVKSSYLETDLITISARPEQIDSLILMACQEVEMKALQKEIIIDFKECRSGCSFDSRWTLEALCNILENAIKYSPEHSRISIEVIPYELFFRIDIRDSGIGIAEEEQGLIFKRFYRSPQVLQQNGLGIGLYLTREIITRQGGFIRVASKPLKGSTFSVFLSR